MIEADIADATLADASQTDSNVDTCSIEMSYPASDLAILIGRERAELLQHVNVLKESCVDAFATPSSLPFNPIVQHVISLLPNL